MGPARIAGRQPLAGHWSVAAVDPGAPKPDDSQWLPTGCAQTAAAALRDAGHWSLDGPPRDFDAQDWWFRACFESPGEGVDVLGMDGLATLAHVWLNGEPLLRSDNMFVRHRCPVDGMLRPGGNELLIRVEALGPELARRRPRPRWRTPMVSHQQLRWMRTTLLGRTPGWSPPAAPVGPWRDVWLGSAWDCIAQEVHLTATLRGEDGEVDLRWSPGPALAEKIESACLLLARDAQTVAQAPVTRGSGGWHARLRIAQVARWWPHTHGAPVLYTAGLRLGLRDGGTRDVALGALGFRTLHVERSDGDFRLHVNEVPVFCRGAGWTPLDPVGLRADAQAVSDAVAQARTAGMNMLRVPGTTVYEEDVFYDACDAQGMLVWQDFMFASMDYPGDDPAFVATCALEARQQLQRLHHRPCLAVLCGNSEVEQQAAMWGAPRELWQPALFHRSISSLCAEQAPHVPYWPSSAHGGAFPHQANEGTTSYYGVGAYLRPLDDARLSALKFATECLAFANIPARATLARMPGGLDTRAHHPAWKSRSPRDLGAGWDFDDVRDHYIERLFGLRPDALRYVEHERYLVFGRAATAYAMEAAFTEWRRPQSACGGALLLFMRDLWAGAGWGVVDDSGLPKACWYALKRVLQPVCVTLSNEGMSGVMAHVISEQARATKLQLSVSAWREDGTRVAHAARVLHLGPHAALSVACMDLFDHALDLGWAWRFGPPLCDVIQAELRDEQGTRVSDAFLFPLGLGMCVRPRSDLGLSATARMEADGQARVLVRAQRLAVGVYLDFPGWLADVDHFHLAPGSCMEVRLSPSDPASPGLAGTVGALNSSTEVTVEFA